MRTTFLIDDDLYREVKALAAYRGTTVTSIVEESLRALIAKTGTGRSGALPVLPHTEGVRQGIDINDNAAIREILDEG